MISFKKDNVMGGIGSGSWCRFNTQTTIEEVHSVDIRFLKKQGYLNPGVSGTLSWNCGGEKTGSIRFKIIGNYLQLNYRQRHYGEEWEDKEELIRFDWTDCNYGGKRPWLLCPHCSRRVGVLHGLNSGFLCRHCYKLPYGSQREGYLDRLIRKARKIRKRLGSDSEWYGKPKGMHWKTFDRLANEEQSIDEVINSAINARLLMF